MKGPRVWSGTAAEFGKRRFRIVGEYDVVVVGGVAVDLREAKRTGRVAGTDLEGKLLVTRERKA